MTATNPFLLYTQAILSLKGKVRFSSHLNVGCSLAPFINRIQRRGCRVTSEARPHDAFQPLPEPFGIPTLGRPAARGEAQLLLATVLGVGVGGSH